MSAPLKIPMPLRVPELAPSLGRLIVPRRLAEPWVPLDDIREELVTQVLELGGRARAAAMREERDEVLAATARPAWNDAWQRAVRRAAERVAQALDQEIASAGYRVRMPGRLRLARRLSSAEQRAIAARLAGGGGPLIAALDELDAIVPRARDASVLDTDAHQEWQAALCTAARRLEAAWLALEQAVEDERRRWAPEIADVAAWRPPLWPLVVLWIPFAAGAVWLGLMLGGYLPAPPWLAELLGF